MMCLEDVPRRLSTRPEPFSRVVLFCLDSLKKKKLFWFFSPLATGRGSIRAVAATRLINRGPSARGLGADWEPRVPAPSRRPDAERWRAARPGRGSGAGGPGDAGARGAVEGAGAT